MGQTTLRPIDDAARNFDKSKPRRHRGGLAFAGLCHQWSAMLSVVFSSGFLLDYHLRLVWNVSVLFPYVSICSKGVFAEYSVISCQLFILLTGTIGCTAISLFIYRMKAVNQHVENHERIRKCVQIMKFVFYLFFLVTMIFSIVIYPEWRYQMEHKRSIQQKFGSLPSFVWCDNCFFLRFDTWPSKLFFIFGYCAISSAFVTGLLAAIETLRVLYSKHLKLSAKTACVQRNLTYNLVVVSSVHITLVFVPFAVFLAGNFIIIDYQSVPTSMVILLQDHGSFATFTMILTNSLLRRSARELFRIPSFCPTRGRVSQGTGSSGVVNVMGVL